MTNKTNKTVIIFYNNTVSHSFMEATESVITEEFEDLTSPRSRNKERRVKRKKIPSMFFVVYCTERCTAITYYILYTYVYVDAER
jgi:hypothetical protein